MVSVSPSRSRCRCVTARAALETRKHLRGRLAPRHAVRPVRADENGKAAPGLGEALEQRRARRVSPVEVVEDGDGGPCLRDVGEDRLRPRSIRSSMGC